MPPSLAARVTLRAPSYTVNPYRRTQIPTRYELHLMNRLGTGYSRGTWGQMKRAGGAQKWFAQQLRPERVAESTTAKALETWFPGRHETPSRRWSRHVIKSHEAWEYARDLGCYTMLRRIYSNRPVLETMTDFWSNHFHITANADLAWVHRDDYDKTIRRHALGRFDKLLEEMTLHPAMLLYLDNWRSVRNAPNENHGRELLELHTVGRTSGYTEEMVKDSAKILSGWTVDAKATWSRRYDTSLHTTGGVRVLGFEHANAAADGAQLSKDYLRYLARHPATARTIARKLAIRFVSDTPPAGLVDHLARVYLRSGTDISAVLRALVAHRSFKRSVGKKVRTPSDDLVQTCRVLGVQAKAPRHDRSFAIAIAWVTGGENLFLWPRPDGAPETNDAWSATSRILGSFRMHWNLAGGWWPKEQVAYRAHRSWLPQRRLRFDQFVDHLSRMLLGRGSTPRLLQAAVEATGCRPGEVVTATHPAVTWKFVRLAAVLLDSPTHLSR
jgi:uncharacterized protein (DUF1800 family)